MIDLVPEISDNRFYEMVCGLDQVCSNIIKLLKEHGWSHSRDSNLTILMDLPFGYALDYLDSNSFTKIIVITSNPCPEYWDDILDYKPDIFLANDSSISDILNALNHILLNQGFKTIPNKPTNLNPLERKILRFSALGWNNKKIASHLTISEGTVKNKQSTIHSKLGLDNKSQSVLYYWGLWHVLSNE